MTLFVTLRNLCRNPGRTGLAVSSLNCVQQKFSKKTQFVSNGSLRRSYISTCVFVGFHLQYLRPVIICYVN